MLIQQLVPLIFVFSVQPSVAYLSISATETLQPVSAVQTTSAMPTLQPSPSQTSAGLTTHLTNLDSTAASSRTTVHPTLSSFTRDARNQASTRHVVQSSSHPVSFSSAQLQSLPKSAIASNEATTIAMTSTVKSQVLSSVTNYIEPSPSVLPFRTSILVTSQSVGASVLSTAPSTVGIGETVITASTSESAFVAPHLSTVSQVLMPSFGTSNLDSTVAPSLGTSVMAPSLGTSAAAVRVTPSLRTSAPAVTPSLGTPAPVIAQSLGTSAPVVAPSLGKSAPVVTPSLGTSAPVVASSLGTPAPVVTPSLGTSAPVVAPSLGTSAPVVTPSLGTLAPVVAPTLGTSTPVVTPSLGTPTPSLGTITSPLGTPTQTAKSSLGTPAPFVTPSYGTLTQAPSVTSSLKPSRSIVSLSLRSSATPSTSQLSTVRLATSRFTAAMQTSTVLISPSAVRSMSPVTATAIPNVTATTAPHTLQIPVLQAQSFDVISRSSDVFNPAEGATIVFNYVIRNTGPTDLPPNSDRNLQIKVYLTDSAQLDGATVVSRPADATGRPLHTARIRQGIQRGEAVELSDVSAQVSVSQANCSSYTHLCVAFEIHGTDMNQTKAGVCKPLRRGQGGVGALDCSKVIGECSATCDANANCIQDNGKTSCVCVAGFTGDGHVCWDEDECKSAPCADVPNSRCVNTAGSYHCACVPGYVRTDGECRATVAFQADVRFFAYNYTDAFSNSSSAEYRELADIYSTEMTSLYLASPLANVFRSVEVLGFRRGSVIGTHAVNVAEGSGETASTVSSALQNAIQSAGGTALQMSAKVEVTDYDECASPDSNDCSPHAVCENQLGGFTCLCRTGYQDRSPQGRPGRKCYNSTLVAGVTMGLVASALLIIVLAVCCCRRRKRTEPVGVGDLVWGKQGVRSFWWPGEVVQGRNGNSLWVRWFGLNTFSPVSELKVHKFQSLKQHYDSEANKTMQSYREALKRVLEKKNSQRRDMYELTLENETLPSYSETVLDESTPPEDHPYQDVINEYARLMVPPSRQIDESIAEVHGYTNGALLEDEGPYREMEVR